MLKTEGEFTTITCDKCGRHKTAKNNSYNEVFYADGWWLNKGRKYEHLCNNCLPDKSRKADNFIKEKFKLPHETKNTILGSAHLFLHNHPKMEAELNVDKNHVIIDREDWEVAIKYFIHSGSITTNH